MIELFQLIPFPLLILSIVLVIFPTIFTAIVRIRLYKHLIFLNDRVRRLINGESPGKKTRIIENLEARFEKASQNLEEVNTAALVDGIYSQEKFDFLGFRLRCHQWDYFSQALPNLLISFGLLGTFLGMTINLSSLIQKINQVKTTNTNESTDINNLLEQLEDPIQGMGIAFITSLIAVACSSLLTVINLQWNTNLAREDLISYLEDYLDNILQPRIEGKSRLDKSVNLMVKQQNDFLNRFHENVTNAVESSLGEIAREISQGNREAANLARQIYERFTESSGTISRAASEFESVINNFQNIIADEMKPTVKKFNRASKTFKQSQFPKKLSEASQNLATIQQNFSNSTSALEETVEVMKESSITLNNNSETLGSLAEEIINLNQNYREVLESHQINQQSLQEIIPQLNEGANNFESASQIIQDLQNQIQVREESLVKIQSELANLVETLKENSQEVNTEIQNFGSNLIDKLVEQVGNNNQKYQTLVEKFGSDNQEVQTLLEKIEESVGYLSDIKSKLDQLESTLESQNLVSNIRNLLRKSQ
ncbi:MAG: hypothetical protein F6K40_00795 [Okeania sp. SIO3I5]|uniref:hypothetical protein n=1 Tax=Okeania sp. SIO3I5 TaxID=2607805 RepID=UPI0013B64A85|nr:hypothetical protein [Okeania sp. SIO3I5]NEQ34922.1 hypothetical protein [Okeania sp. SIO3I5]